MKIGLFGGTFDPIHRGHVEPVVAARAQLGLEVVYFLPTANPPHKDAFPRAAALARYAMAELALLAHRELQVCSWELTPGRKAYTVETLERFRRELPDSDLHLLVGSDSLAQLTSWHRWREILSLARLVILRRPGWRPEDGLVRVPELLAAFEGGRLTLVEHVAQDCSSTELRKRLTHGAELPFEALSPLVLDYIRKYRLYDETTASL